MEQNRSGLESKWSKSEVEQRSGGAESKRSKSDVNLNRSGADSRWIRTEADQSRSGASSKSKCSRAEVERSPPRGRKKHVAMTSRMGPRAINTPTPPTASPSVATSLYFDKFSPSLPLPFLRLISEGNCGRFITRSTYSHVYLIHPIFVLFYFIFFSFFIIDF